ncbi:MAG: choice-of-anchor B family protein, partial [Chloroflexi bacterium]
INTYTWTGNGFSTAHNLFIDENGYAYICGANIYNGGVFILNLNASPVNPPVVGAYTRAYVHDLFVRGDTMWTAEINNGQFGVVNVSNKANPQLLALQNTPGNFAHNVWLSANGKYLFTTDEISGGVIAAYDVSDLNNISELGRFQSNPGSGVIPHNVFWHQDFLVISYYRDGVVIADATYPNNIIQTGAYDTSPLSGNGFNGCWGVYPYLPSGNILASDIESGLFVLTPAYVHACFLEGLVSDSTTGLPLNGVTIELVNQNITTQSGLDGRYYTGIATAGSYSVRFSKQGYVTRTVPAVPLTNGNLVTLNVALIPSSTFTLTGTVTDTANGNGIQGVQIFITDNISKSWTAT